MIGSRAVGRYGQSGRMTTEAVGRRVTTEGRRIVPTACCPSAYFFFFLMNRKMPAPAPPATTTAATIGMSIPVPDEGSL